MTGFSLSLPCSDTFAASPRVVLRMMFSLAQTVAGTAAHSRHRPQ